MINVFSKYRKWQWLFFVFWPFGLLISTIKNYRSSNLKNVIWMFCVFFGYTMVFSSQGQDSERYIDVLKYLHTNINGLGEFREYVISHGITDVVQIIIVYLVSIFTDSSQVLFAFHGFVFGYFYSRNVGFVINKCEGDLKLITVMLIWVFSMIVGVWMINGFRFWTAAHIFLFGIYNLFFMKKNNGYLLLFLATLTHFAFWVPIIIVIVYKLIGAHLRLYFLFFVITFFIQELDVSFVRLILGKLPAIFSEKASVYVGDEALENFANKVSNFNWYIIWSPRIVRYIITVGVVLIMAIHQNKRQVVDSFFSFALLFAGFANMGALLPSGGRLIIISELLLISIIIWHIQNELGNKVLNLFYRLSIPFMIFTLIVSLRYLLGSMSVTTIIGNPILASLFYIDGAIIDLIR